MAAYRPFLLPLIPSDKGTAFIANTPLEEEAHIQEIEISASEETWAYLARQCLKTYGLPLLLEVPASAQPTSLDEVTPASPGHRYLVLNNTTPPRFVLEHPDALPLFDAMGHDEQRPSLARPSLFIECLNRSAQNQSDEAVPAVAEDESSRAAFYNEIAALLKASPLSDWHLEPLESSYRSRTRTHGRLGKLTHLTKTKGDWLIRSALRCAHVQDAAHTKALDGSFDLPDTEGQTCVRIATLPCLHGTALTMRFLPQNNEAADPLSVLGFGQNHITDIQNTFPKKDGLWLVAGPTGSGKSTTLHALLQMAVKQHEKVLSAEDPVERILENVQQVEINAAKGIDFAHALRAFLRQSPDCLMVGEIRDPATADIAVQAARTGHRVISSIHARDTPGVIRRLEDLGQPYRQIYTTCQRLIHQRLVPLLCPHCAIDTRLSPHISKILQPYAPITAPQPRKASGCSRCTEGYSGRIGLFSINRFLLNESNAHDLQKRALALLFSGRSDLSSVAPYLPILSKSHFPLCQS